jgi:PAS domain S-box-containing protein
MQTSTRLPAAASAPAYGDLPLRVLENLFAFVGVLELDGTLVYANDAPLQAAGLQIGDVRGRKFWDCHWWCYDEGVSAAVQAACERAARGETVRYEAVVRMANDSRMTIDFQVSPLRDGGGTVTHLIPTGVDIGERKKAEEALRQSEELVRTIAENSTQGFAMMDQRGYCTYANKAWLDMTGYTREEIGSAPLHDLVHHHRPDGSPYPMQECPIDRALPENFDVRAHEDLFFRKDGSSFPVLCAASPIFKDGRPVSTVIEIRDVTEAKRAEAEVGDREAQFRSLADNLPTLAWMANADGWITWYNRRWYEYTGTTPEQMEGWGWESVHDPAWLPTVKQSWQASIASGAPFEMTFPLKGADGVFRPFLTRIVPVRDEQGRITRWFGTNTDVSPEREIQARLEASEAALREADRRKDEFIAVLAHELRNPLAPIQNAVEIIGRLDVNEPRVERMRSLIGRQVAHMRRLIDDLLDVARIARGRLALQLGDCDLARVAQLTAEDYRETLEAARIALRIEAAAPLPVRGDPVRLAQCIGNYLQNAARFAQGSDVTVHAFQDAGRSEAVVAVADTGPGLPEGLIPNLFTPFAQADQGLARSQGGLGLGLSLTKGLVELHGGRVAVASEPGGGARFEIRVPLGGLPRG